MAKCIIVVPCYNEAKRLRISAFQQFVAEGHPQRFLFVNDCSTDDTRDVLEALRRSDPQRFAVRDLPQNKGKAEAVRQGMLEALTQEPAFVGYWDADLATPLGAIPQFFDVLNSNPELQLAIGSRVRLLGRSIERRPTRHYLGRVFATAASLVLRLPIYDTQCGAKLIRVSPATRGLFAQPFRTNWVFDVELLARFLRSCSKKTGFSAADSIYEIPLAEWRDVEGSKVKAGDFFKAFFELYTIYRAHRRFAEPTAKLAGREVSPLPLGLPAGGVRTP